MRRFILLAALFATAASAMENEELKQKPPRVVFDSPRGIDGAMQCIDEGRDVWGRYLNARDRRLYRKQESVDVEYLTAPATVFAIQSRVILLSISNKPGGGSHIQIWGAPAVDMLDPDDAASRGHAAYHANKNSRLQQSIDSLKICLAQPDPRVASAAPAALPLSIADELAKLADLKAKGVITADEFDAQKAKLFAAR